LKNTADRVEVIEASEYERERIGESIPPDTHRLFDELGLLAAFQAEGHEPCFGSASSWGADELGYNDFVFNPYGKGWHLDRRRFDKWLAREVEASGVRLRRGLRFRDVIDHGRDGAVVTIEGTHGVRERIATRFVVDATGTRSLYARRMGAVRRSLDRLVSVAAFFRLPEGSSFAKLTLLEAVDYGWWYVAQLPDRRIVTAVATSHEIYKRRRFDRAPNWLDALSRTRHLSPVLAECQPVRASFLVSLAPSFLLDRIFGDHWLAVGDAASAYDPISSQGIYKALRHGLAAGRAIVRSLSGEFRENLDGHQRDIEAAFSEYARQRAYFYDLERRFPDAPFWVERQGEASFELPGAPEA
jgi:flavin-dependent dehydrogenase